MTTIVDVIDQRWGSSGNQKSKIFMMEGDSPISAPVTLPGEAVTGLSQETVEVAFKPIATWRNGVQLVVNVPITPTQVLSESATILPGPFLYTPSLQKARLAQEGQFCLTEFAVVDPCSNFPHAKIMRRVVVSPPSPVEDLIINTSDAPVANSEQFTITATGPSVMQFEPKGYVSIASSNPLYALTTIPENCPDCESSQFNAEFIAGGGDGTAAGTLLRSLNRFATSTALTSAIPAASVASDIWTDGTAILASFNASSATTGGTVFAANGINFTVDVGITNQQFSVAKVGQFYISVGGSTTGEIFISTDGVNWSATGGAFLSAITAGVLRKIRAVGNAAYVVGDSATFFRMSLVGNAFTFEDLSSLLPGVATTNLTQLAILENEPAFDTLRVAVGGGGGYYAESVDGAKTFTRVVLPTTANLTALFGTGLLTVIAAGTNVWFRTPYMHSNQFVRLTYAGTPPTGAVTAGVAGTVFSYNYAAFVTNNGEFVQLRPQHPNA